MASAAPTTAPPSPERSLRIFRPCHTAKCHSHVQDRGCFQERGSGRTRCPLDTLTAVGDFSPAPFGSLGLQVPNLCSHCMWLGLGAYRRAGVPRGVCGERGRLAGRGGAGAGAGPMASLHGHIEELKLEEPCEERAVVFQLPGKNKARGREWSLSDPQPAAPAAPAPGRARPPFRLLPQVAVRPSHLPRNAIRAEDHDA